MKKVNKGNKWGKRFLIGATLVFVTVTASGIKALVETRSSNLKNYTMDFTSTIKTPELKPTSVIEPSTTTNENQIIEEPIVEEPVLDKEEVLKTIATKIAETTTVGENELGNVYMVYIPNETNLKEVSWLLDLPATKVPNYDSYNSTVENDLTHVFLPHYFSLEKFQNGEENSLMYIHSTDSVGLHSTTLFQNNISDKKFDLEKVYLIFQGKDYIKLFNLNSIKAYNKDSSLATKKEPTEENWRNLKNKTFEETTTWDGLKINEVIFNTSNESNDKESSIFIQTCSVTNPKDNLLITFDYTKQYAIQQLLDTQQDISISKQK